METANVYMKGSQLPQPARELDCLFTSDSCLAFNIYLRLRCWRCMLRLSDIHLPGPLDLPSQTSLSFHSHSSLSVWSLPCTSHHRAWSKSCPHHDSFSCSMWNPSLRPRLQLQAPAVVVCRLCSCSTRSGATWHVGSQLPNQGSAPRPLLWKVNS